MFGIGGGELVFIIFIALMLFGADKIPEIARSLGKGMAQLKNATNEILWGPMQFQRVSLAHCWDTHALGALLDQVLVHPSQ